MSKTDSKFMSHFDWFILKKKCHAGVICCESNNTDHMEACGIQTQNSEIKSYNYCFYFLFFIPWWGTQNVKKK